MMGPILINQQAAGGRYARSVMLPARYSPPDGGAPNPAIAIDAPWIDVAVARWSESNVDRLTNLTALRRFQRLVREWKSRNTASSLVIDHIQHPAYQKIIGMGEKAVPLLLDQLRDEGDDPDHWFWALHVITEQDPVPAADRGNTVRMSAAWLEWGGRDAHAR